MRAPASYTKLFEGMSESPEIWYADAPPLLGGIAKKLSIEEFKAKIEDPTLHLSENTYLDCEPSEILAIPFPKRPQLVARAEPKLLNPSTYYDSLVVCNMGKFGHGVFARKLIPAGEIIGFYAGVVSKKEHPTTPYSLAMLEKNKATGMFSVDASRIGGIARFFQHLPLNTADTAEQLVKELRRKIAYFDHFFISKVEEDQSTPEEYASFRYALMNDLMTMGDAELFKGMITYRAKEDQREWEVDNLEAEPTIKANIAYANIEQVTILIKNKPVVLFFASRTIAPGEQLGFSYGLGYWISSAKTLPRVFFKSGAPIPESAYHWKSIPIEINTTIGPRTFFYSQEEYKAEIDRQKPKSFHPLANKVSFFTLRKKLAAEGIIDSRHAALKQDNSLIQYMRKLFSEKIKFELFWHNPDNKDLKKQYDADLYCKADSKDVYDSLKEALLSSSIRDKVFLIESTLEIIIRRVNHDTEIMRQFVLDFRHSLLIEKPSYPKSTLSS